MNDLFISDQRWVYTNGATLADALHGLADALDDIEGLPIPKEHNPTINDAFLAPSLIEVLYTADAKDDTDTYRVGICISWTPGKVETNAL